jgi:hypothetical protein
MPFLKCDLWGRNEGQLSLQINSWLGAISFYKDFSWAILYENEFQNPQIFQQTISLFPEQIYFNSHNSGQ